MVSFLNKIANLIKLSMVIILFFPSLHSSPPPAEDMASSSSLFGAKKTSVPRQFCCRRSLQFKNGEKCDSLRLRNLVNDPSLCDSNPSLVHIAMTLDHHFFRGTVAAIHSVLHHSSCPENIFFHFIFTDFGDLQLIIRDIFPSLRFKTYYFNSEIVRKKISPSVRQALEEPLNYARNYLAELLEPCVERVIYLDSDVILVDDISKLWISNLFSRTLGSPEYCHVNFTKYFTPKFWSEKSFSNVFNGRRACYFNTGVIVIDLVRWRKFGYTRKIERWMKIQRQHRIYELGSLPPFLLVFAGEIAAIDHRWNQHGLGGDNLTGNCRPMHAGPVSLLHWSGKGKPWIRLESNMPCPLDIIWSRYDLCGTIKR